MRTTIKIKLFIFLFVIMASVIFFFTWFTITDFRIDKTAQTLESNLFAIKSVALQIRSEIDGALEKSGFYLKGLNLETGEMAPGTDGAMQSDPNLIGLWVVGLDSSSAEPAIKSKIPSGRPLPKIDEKPFLQSDFVREAISSGFSMHFNGDDTKSWYLGFRLEKSQPNRPMTILLHLRNARFTELFSLDSLFEVLILNRDDFRLAYASKKEMIQDQDILSSIRSSLSSGKKGVQGITEIKTHSQDILVAYSTLGVANYIVVGVKDKNEVFASIRKHIQKSWYFSGVIFFLLIGTSIIASVSLTRRLSELVKATEKISQGNFDVQVETHSSDEFGVLADSFNKMAHEVKRLLTQTKESARMESELKTAQIVQQNLFPPGQFSNSDLQIAGHYTPASECGGDWWYYHFNEDEVYFWIGDATGHGVSAALVTSAVRAVASMTEHEPSTLENIATRLNLSVQATSHGLVNMTFFLAKINVKTLKLSYINCSHEPPLLIHSREKFKKQDLIPLHENICPRLGESVRTTFKSSVLDLKKGDTIFIYTDGLFEIMGPDGITWNERNLHKFFLENRAQTGSVIELRDHLVEHLNSFRRFVPLIDDLTFFAIHIRDELG